MLEKPHFSHQRRAILARARARCYCRVHFTLRRLQAVWNGMQMRCIWQAISQSVRGDASLTGGRVGKRLFNLPGAQLNLPGRFRWARASVCINQLAGFTECIITKYSATWLWPRVHACMQIGFFERLGERWARKAAHSDWHLYNITLNIYSRPGRFILMLIGHQSRTHKCDSVEHQTLFLSRRAICSLARLVAVFIYSSVLCVYSCLSVSYISGCNFLFLRALDAHQFSAAPLYCQATNLLGQK